MLDALRSRSGSWVAKIFIGLLAASFAVWGVADVFTGYRGDVLATVGDVEITSEEYRTAFNRRLRSISSQLGRTITPGQAREIGLDRQVLQQMINDAALRAQASSLGLAVPDRTVARKIADNPAFRNAQGEFNPEEFRQLLLYNGISEAEFVASERGAMLSSAIADALDSGFEPPRPLVESIWNFRNQRRDARYFVVRPDDVTVAEASEQELRQFYDDNPSLFTTPERRQIAVMHADPADLGTRIDVTEDEIEAAYERNASEYGTPERRVVQQIPFADDEEAREAYERISDGASFLDIAREKGLSQDDATLGEVTRESIPDPALAEAAFALEEGEVSAPVEGRLSTVLLRVTEISPASQKPLDEVRDDIVRTLQTDRGRDEALNVYDRVEDGRAGGESFEDIASSLGLTVRTVEVDRSGTGPDGEPVDLPAEDQVLRTAFELDVGVEADAVSTEDDGFVWVDVRAIEPEVVEPFEDVKDDVVAAWKQRQVADAVVERARELQQQAEAGTPLEDLARQVGSEVKTVTDVSRGRGAGADFDASAVQALFAAPPDGYAVAPQPNQQSALVIKSSPVLATPFDSASEDARTVANALRTGLSDDVTAQYLSALQSNFKVEINQELLNQVTGGAV